MDGSHHDWLEGHGPRCVLMALTEDATSGVRAGSTSMKPPPLWTAWVYYIRQHGILLAVYTDKHATYKSPAQPTVDKQVEGGTPHSQFERNLTELGVRVIPAHSPEAKGRVERLFANFEDRLITELRLAGIPTLATANRFLEDYLPRNNQLFVVPPAQTTDLHRPISGRPGSGPHPVLQDDTRFPSRLDGGAPQAPLSQIHDPLRATHVQVEERLDGTCASLTAGRSPIRSSTYASACPGQAPQPPAPGHDDAGASVTHTTAARARITCGGGQKMNPDVSKLG